VQRCKAAALREPMRHPLQMRCMLAAAVAAMTLACLGCAGHRPVTVAETPPLADDDGTPRPIAFQGSSFKQVASVGDVVVYEQSVSSLIRIGAEGRFPAPPAEVLAVLLDYPRHAEVLERVSECRVLDRGSNSLRLYQRLALPIVDDRDFALEVTWGQQAEWRWIRYRAARHGPPLRDGVVRVTRNSGGWDLRPIEGGAATLARYRSELDLAGMLPSWVTSSGAADELPSMFQSMCKLLPKPYSDRCGSVGEVASSGSSRGL